MDRAYLARHYFDGQRLARRAITEFAAAMRSGRTVAFVGSWATQTIRNPPYPEWRKFLELYAQCAAKLMRHGTAEARSAVRAATRALKSANNSEDAIATLSVIEYALQYATDNGSLRLDMLRRFGSSLFELESASRTLSSVHAILAELGIDRIVTLNYDLEFEWELMTTSEEKDIYSANRQVAFRPGGGGGKNCVITYDEESRSLARTLPNGRTIISDIFWQERTDRLIEFAVGSPDQDAHILHLHGRMTHPTSMVISQRDYNEQYRRSGVARLPFEHALRMLFSGNPILFVGVGMTERDVTATLEQFVSDHPNRRISPAFILWNAPPDQYQKDAIRFRWLHRFGVLTLFDDEVSQIPERSLRHLDPVTERIPRSIQAIAARVASCLAPFGWAPSDLRSIRKKFDGDPSHVDAWHPVRPVAGRLFEQAKINELADFSSLITVGVAEPGVGKGAIARSVRDAWHKLEPAGRSCIINASFAFETDSIFSLISGLGDSIIASDQNISRSQALHAYVENTLIPSAGTPPQGPSPRKLLVIINGAERFFSPSGVPLSSELDGLVRKVGAAAMQAVRSTGPTLVAQGTPTSAQTPSSPGAPPAPPKFDPPLRILILGTARIKRYLETFERTLAPLISYSADFSAPILRPPSHLRSVYFQGLIDRFEKCGLQYSGLDSSARALIEQKVDGDRAGVRRAVLAAYLNAESLKRAGTKRPGLCLDLLTVMAFIGQPVEDAVLAHAPRVQRCLPDISSRDEGKRAAARRDFDEAISHLSKLGLITEVYPFQETPAAWRRYGLHRAVLTELRDRHGVPLSDSQLSVAFNLSIFSAQQSDGYSPEREIHEELGTLADWLIGAYKDPPLGPEASVEDEGPVIRWRPSTRSAILTAAKESRRAWPHVSACLRAALALMRSYYSTSALLTLDRSDRPPSGDQDGPLTEHADRIERLLNAAKANAEARRTCRGRLPRRAEAWLGPAPFYADDLVWLQNELGVVKLAQGDLYEARRAFEDALRLNRDHVEFTDRSQNWRRITLNQVHVDIERGALDRAEARMDQIEEALSDSIGLPISEIRDSILERYAFRIEREIEAIHPEIEYDAVLNVGLVYGYRALCLHLRGHLRASRTSFELCTAILEKIGEQRAYAMFQRHLASLLAVLEDTDGVKEALRLSVASAEATRQTDLVYLSRISEAQQAYRRVASANKPVLLRQLQTALHYAEAGDMHRVRVEAGLNLARIKQADGDFDAALEHAADAMATATRYGLSLRKVSIRILMGQILMNRGDPQSGKALIDKAIRNADRINYQRAIETAQNVLAMDPSSRAT